MHEPQRVAPHLQRARPRREGEHGRPVEPEVGGEEVLGEALVDALVVEVLLAREREVQQLLHGLRGEGQIGQVVDALAAAVDGPARVGRRVLLVQPVHLVQDTGVRGVEGGDGAEEVPQRLEVRLHLPSAADDEALVLVIGPVHAPPGDGELLVDGDRLPRQLGVPDEEGGSRQGSQAGADEVDSPSLGPCRLGCPRVCLEIAVGPVHELCPVARVGARCTGLS